MKLRFISLFVFGLYYFFGCNRTDADTSLIVNDISRLNPTKVNKIIPANSLGSLQKAIRIARTKNLKISISGKQHSQGGHAFYDNAVILNMTHFNQILDLDVGKKIHKYVDQHTEEAISLVEKVVNINSGALNIAGNKTVGKIFQAELDQLGFNTYWVIYPETIKRSGHLFAEMRGGTRILLMGQVSLI